MAHEPPNRAKLRLQLFIWLQGGLNHHSVRREADWHIKSTVRRRTDQKNRTNKIRASGHYLNAEVFRHRKNLIILVFFCVGLSIVLAVFFGAQ